MNARSGTVDRDPAESRLLPSGSIAIANPDVGADGYTHTAIDQARRAVGDLRRRRA